MQADIIAALTAGELPLELYIDVAVYRGADRLGELTGPAGKLLAWAVEDYGPGVRLERIYS